MRRQQDMHRDKLLHGTPLQQFLVYMLLSLSSCEHELHM